MTTYTFNGNAAVLANSVTTSISGAVFSDGATLSGTWTANYDSAGDLLDQVTATFIVTSVSGQVTKFTSMGTLPYANTTGSTSYELHSLSQTGSSFSALYVDWTTETPSSFYEGTPSFYTSVVDDTGATATAALRLVDDGTTGNGSIPVITGMSAQSGLDTATYTPFGKVVVTDSDTATSATITLTSKGVATYADGTLSGTGLSKVANQPGVYSLTATTPAKLTAELEALKFTPTVGQVANGATVATLFDLSVNDADGSASASTTLTVTATCFLRGTMIATPDGELPVEALAPGDLVVTIEQGVRVTRPVTWTGGRDIDAADHQHRDEAYPVRIVRGAFGAGVPHRDLLVTQEHCILTEAGLVPARMLVNGRSIRIDRDMPAYSFFHVELERHGILLAEGLQAESYLDTGNRGLFGGEASRSVTTRPAMAAPLATARALVEPVWTRLAARADQLGFPHHAAPACLSDRPDLRVLLDDGRELDSCWHDRQRHMFHIPRDARPVRLLSRAAVPAQAIGPFVDDRRRLGVAVEQLVLWTGLDETIIPAEGLRLQGWHDLEGTHRWTDGEAALDLPAAGASTFLDIHLAATGRYPEQVAA